jgi:hypothetical protein
VGGHFVDIALDDLTYTIKGDEMRDLWNSLWSLEESIIGGRALVSNSTHRVCTFFACFQFPWFARA